MRNWKSTAAAAQRPAPSAWASRTLVHVEDLLTGGAKSRYMTRAEDAMIWRDLQSLIAVPIFARPEDAKNDVQIPQRILCINANVLLRRLATDPAFELWLRDRIVLLSWRGVKDQIDAIIKGFLIRYRSLVGGQQRAAQYGAGVPSRS